MRITLLITLFLAATAFSATLPFPFVIEPLEEEYTSEEKATEEIAPKSAEKEVTVKEFSPSHVEKEKIENITHFPISPKLQHQVDFWISVYTKYTSSDVIIHDSKFPRLVYEVLDFKHITDLRTSYRRKLRKMNKIVKSRKRHYKGLLKKIHRKIKNNQTAKLTEEEQKIFNKFNEIDEPNKFYRATYRKRMRMQIGQSNNFITGIKNSGKYLPYIEDIFKEAKLPLELTRLIFVESMFNLRAYSKVGASGIWQFMRYTGKRFLEISFAVDERRDPITATHAASKLLTANYKRLKTWPLAITAYNHGARGMERAAKRVGTTNFIDIIDKYKSRTFGFASKNFYAQFLAAVEVESNQKFYFNEIEKHQPVNFKEYIIPDFLSFNAIPNFLGLSTKVIKSLNPALKSEVYSGHARVPKGYKLKIPHLEFDSVVTKYAEIPAKFKHKVQKKRKYYRVKRGDSLWTISRRYRVSLRKLKNINNIRNHRRIIPGQLLILP